MKQSFQKESNKKDTLKGIGISVTVLPEILTNEPKLSTIRLSKEQMQGLTVEQINNTRTIIKHDGHFVYYDGNGETITKIPCQK